MLCSVNQLIISIDELCNKGHNESFALGLEHKLVELQCLKLFCLLLLSPAICRSAQ